MLLYVICNSIPNAKIWNNLARSSEKKKKKRKNEVIKFDKKGAPKVNSPHIALGGLRVQLIELHRMKSRTE